MGKNQVAQLELEGLTGVDVLPPGSAPLSFLQQVLEHSCRLTLMPLGKTEQALQGGRNKCLHKTISRPRFYAGLQHFIIEENLGESWTSVCHCIYMYGQKKKAIYFH